MGAFVRAVAKNPLLVWTSREIVGWTPFLFILILLFQLDLNSFKKMLYPYFSNILCI